MVSLWQLADLLISPTRLNFSADTLQFGIKNLMKEIKLMLGVTPSEHEIARARVLWVVKRQLNPFYTIALPVMVTGVFNVQTLNEIKQFRVVTI